MRALSSRTWRGRATAVGHLDALAVVLRPMGYQCVALYAADELPVRPALLWVFAFGPRGHVRVAVGVRAVPGGGWAYYEAGRGRFCPCDDVEGAAELVDRLLKHRMFPATW
ncbi:hypothetical protein [Actinomadura sp. WMMB 499]|uniref:hypothetical protein n=1 Tax=Actinomadura sp. WMMB 499 TaxID=1219491 RepID=UPI0012464D90|nr:hypothetical protein [Actinomadura sp. WMMB 499]QFG23645.1 hypothetical protein F7P10_23490 [Actinomadura sp. WMMB 499]